MCKSVAEGGQRCASHTRARLSKVAGLVEAAVQSGDASKVVAARDEWMTAAAEYASTDEGRRHFVAQRDASDAAGDFDTAAMLNTVVNNGDAVRAANRETAALINAVRLGEAPTALMPSTADMAVSPAALPATSPAVAPDLSAADRAVWDETVARFEAISAQVDTMDGKSPEMVLRSFRNVDAVLANPGASDEQIAKAVGAYQADCTSTLMYMPVFKTWTVRGPNGHVRSSGKHGNDETRAEWSDVTGTLWSCRDVQLDRALKHPGTGPATLSRMVSNDASMTRKATGHPAFPIKDLNKVMREQGDASTDSGRSIHPDAWQRARDVRMSNPAVALTLAAKDPDSWERHEAVNQLVMTPFDTLSEPDRAWLASNLDQIPNRANQKILAESLVAYAKSYADDAERSRLADVLSGRVDRSGRVTLPSQSHLSEEVRAIGETLGSGAVSLVRPEPKRRRGLFARS